MFRKKTSWYFLMFKALLFSGVLYKFARLFMKSAEKLGRAKPAKRRSKG